MVNGKAITSISLENRVRLVLSSSNIPDTPETRKRFMPQIRDNLIDETLQQQEAQKWSIAVTPEDMTRAIGDLEQRNNMPKGSFEASLTSRGINKDAALEQIKARLLWQKVMLKRVRSRIAVSQNEIREGQEQFARKQNRREFQLSEIVLPVVDKEKRDNIKQLAARIVAEVRKGGDFGTFARQFSVSSTALQGGDTGWIPEEKLEPEALAALQNTPEGQVTDPVETSIGFRIYKVNKRFSPQDVEVVLKQIHLPPPLPAEALPAFQAASHSITSCENFDEGAQKLKAELPENIASSLGILDLGRLKLSDLSADIRDDVSALTAGQTSPVLQKASGLHLLLVCERGTGGNNTLPDEDKVRDLLLREKLELESRRYLSQLRKAAFIETR